MVCHQSPGMIDWLLELGAARVARPVLRGGGGSDATSLPNQLQLGGYSQMPLPSATAQGIDRQRTRTAKDQRHQAGDVEQVDFVTRRAKLGSLRGEADCLDRTKAVLDVDGKHRPQHRKDQWNTYDGDTCPHEQSQAARNL